MTRQHSGRYRGYKYRQRAYNHRPEQTYDEACCLLNKKTALRQVQGIQIQTGGIQTQTRKDI
jgi:hypothetical protein